MRFAPLPKGRRAQSLLPMIDVVFFLIIFFMMVSHFAAPEPFAVARPVSTGTEAAAGELAVFVKADGTVAALSDGVVLTAEAALAALDAARQARCGDGCAVPPMLLVHADAEAPAAALAGLLPALAGLGFADIRLVTVQE